MTPPTAPTRPFFRCLLLAAALLAGAPVAVLADSTPSASLADNKLAPVRAHLAAKRWADALAELRRGNDSASADWQNLMGYSLRKGTPADLDGADRHYREALRINPRHRGALEYSGELALMKADLPLAEQKLAALDKICSFGCEEYTSPSRPQASLRGTCSTRASPHSASVV